ncbi:hypothetical protein KAR91_06990 [Candidatus Pacearchaeota archaeon]|nr:hypothetical protein [Candidatus Pacearchaeota archaeon]
MITRSSPNGSIIDEDGNLVFPEITSEKLDFREKQNKIGITDVIKFLENSTFSKKRIIELEKLKKDMEDLKMFEKVEIKEQHLKYLENQQIEIKNYRAKNKI